MLENKLGFIRTKWDDKNELGSAPIEKVSARIQYHPPLLRS
ncbi:hypothetical protein ACFPN4_11935 [Ureibacillus thermophilus]